MTATVEVGPPPVSEGPGSGSQASMPASGTASRRTTLPPTARKLAAGPCSAAVPAARRARTSASTAAASSVPIRATAKLTSGTPPYAASDSSGPSVWLSPSRPQGKPPKGARPRSASWPTHSAAVHTGQAGSRVTRAPAPPRSARYSACITARASHGKAPT